ncbi:MAG: ATP-dependent helicase, partial [Microbacterium sp.]
MPKNKKPAVGRAQDFEPRYGKKTSYQDAKRRPGQPFRGAPAPRGREDLPGEARLSHQSSAGKPGSKSPSHRGYRPAEEGAPAKKRWSAEERAGRDDARGIRSQAHGPRR